MPPGRAAASGAGSSSVEFSQLFTTHHYLLTRRGKQELGQEHSSAGIWPGLFAGPCPSTTSAGGPGAGVASAAPQEDKALTTTSASHPMERKSLG